MPNKTEKPLKTGQENASADGVGGEAEHAESYYSQFMIIFNYIAHGSYLLFN